MPRPSARSLLLTAVVLLAIAACASRRQARRERFIARRIESADTAPRRMLVHDGLTRRYVVRAPAGTSRTSAPLPLVLVLHGGGGNATNAEQMTGFTRLVEREHIIVVYPDGIEAREGAPLETWNAGHCCGPAMQRKVDDVGFIAALLDELQRELPVDASRIYVTGMSNGAMMSHRIGRELAPRIAAIAPVVGTVFGDERTPSSPVSALMINGLLDRNIPADGGLSGGLGASTWDGTPMLPYIAQGTFWAAANGCSPAPTRAVQGTVTVSRYGCPDGRRVEVQQVSDNGHAWPGGARIGRVGDVPSTAMRATEVMWAFFASVRKR